MCKRADFPVFPFTSISNPSLSHNYIDKTEKKEEKKNRTKIQATQEGETRLETNTAAAHRKGVVREGRRAACSDALSHEKAKERKSRKQQKPTRSNVLCKSHKCVKGREADQSRGGLAA